MARNNSGSTGDLNGSPDAGLARLPAGYLADALVGSSDLAMLLDADGVIRSIAMGSTDLADHGLDDWIDRPWVETVTVESRPKVVELMAGTSDGEPRRWRQMNHATGAGEIAVKWLAFASGPDGGHIAIGRDQREAARIQQMLLHAQQSIERDYVRLRQVEARYRALFELAGEAVLVVETGSRRIIEANPAAEALFGKLARGLTGRTLGSVIAPDSRDTVTALLGAVAASARAVPARVRVLGDDSSYLLAASLLRQGQSTVFLLRLVAEGAAIAAEDHNDSLFAAIEALPDALVVTDADFAIRFHNSAFLEMSGAVRTEQVAGEPIDLFVGRPGIDFKVLSSELLEHASVRNFATVLRGLDGAEDDVEIAAVRAGEGDNALFGFSIRNVARRMVETPVRAGDAPRSVEQLTDLVGRMPLKEIVRESTDLIERLCIETALAHTSQTRASAAELLGLSRQSLYLKLNKFGLANGTADDD